MDGEMLENGGGGDGTAPKGILKRERKKSVGAEVKWNEENLMVNESERSSTMKIDEPKTPFNFGYSPDESEDVTDRLTSVMEQLHTNTDFNRSTFFLCASFADREKPSMAPRRETVMTTGSESGYSSSHSDFEERRRRHYHGEGIDWKEGKQRAREVVEATRKTDVEHCRSP